MEKIIAHFIREEVMFHCRYWVVPRPDKGVAHYKIAGSEEKCGCSNANDIRRQLEKR